MHYLVVLGLTQVAEPYFAYLVSAWVYIAFKSEEGLTYEDYAFSFRGEASYNVDDDPFYWATGRSTEL